MNRLKADSDSAHVSFPPPLIVLLGALVGWAINFVWPVQLISQMWRWPLGMVFIFIGVGIILYCAKLFQKAHTNIEPWKTTSHIITTGIYGISRNPIYVSFILIGLGIAFAVNSVWIVLMQVFVVFCIQKFVIEKEERYLETKFGEEYRSYQTKVRRWI